MKLSVNSALWNLIFLSLALSIFFIITNPLRLAFIYNSFLPFIAGNFAVSILFFCVFIISIKTVNLELIELILLTLLFFLFLKSLFNYGGFNFNNIVIDFLKPLFFIITVAVIRSEIKLGLTKRHHIILNKTPKMFFSITTMMVFVCLLISYYVIPLYPAFSTIDSIIGFVPGVVKSAFFFLVLFLSGKRGVLLSALVLMLILFVKRLSLDKFILCVCLFFMASIIFSLYAYEYILISLFKVDNLSAIEGLDHIELLSLLGGGRVSEVTSSLAYIKTYSDFIFGLGFGFEYEVESFGDESYVMHRNSHFSPVSFLTLYGAFFTLLFYFYIFKYVCKSISVILNFSERYRLFVPFLGYFIASVVFSFTEYSFFSYLNFSISMGISGACYKHSLKKQLV